MPSKPRRDLPNRNRRLEHLLNPAPFRAFDKLQRVPQGEIVDNKRLSAALAWAQEEQAKASPRQRRTHRPTRRAQGPGPFTT
ncbi:MULTISPECIES: hypothetical protein [unclassified Azospirillum]|uniref:hypothetical protein n=1 Tax=unclassified Azospirillum TaxID=2630922 RepID=UPI000B646878|nr:MULTISPECIES: hypothetical protein [unclassified Azospirillum]SNS52712.1 hypothetical protein SAMN05880556_106137 [Azospirillum sp. RU38E]SNS73049.1 hypothetical protein SAMN05880591_106164 [Azospirillum sp. RU37A]